MPSGGLRKWMLDRRDIFLLMFGTIYLVVGINSLLIPGRRFVYIAPGVGEFLDHPLWGIMWIVGGLVSIGTALRPRRFIGGDGKAFISLLIPPVVWTLFYTGTALSWVITGGEWGRLQSVSGAAVWSFVWMTVLLISGWADPDSLRKKR
jgi:hypothetical protein